ncbi:MAG: hypothetical protein QOD93_6275 [Acetobacteraceae bacterium]|nr:hypothetical protein [Acetobacteraceae bacterium]
MRRRAGDPGHRAGSATSAGRSAGTAASGLSKVLRKHDGFGRNRGRREGLESCTVVLADAAAPGQSISRCPSIRRNRDARPWSGHCGLPSVKDHRHSPRRRRLTACRPQRNSSTIRRGWPTAAVVGSALAACNADEHWAVHAIMEGIVGAQNLRQDASRLNRVLEFEYCLMMFWIELLTEQRGRCGSGASSRTCSVIAMPESQLIDGGEQPRPLSWDHCPYERTIGKKRLDGCVVDDIAGLTSLRLCRSW